MFFFFFQAEDGIRDIGVTGVQTCALPIFVEQVHERYGIVPQAVQPAQSVAQQALAEGPALWDRDPDRCCGIRKVRPLAEALAPFDAWIAGLRRDGGATRANTNLIEWSSKYNLVKL